MYELNNINYILKSYFNLIPTRASDRIKPCGSKTELMLMSKSVG